MYARYIPPPRDQRRERTPSEVSLAVAEEEEPIPSTNKSVRSTSLYNRYVPPMTATQKPRNTQLKSSPVDLNVAEGPIVSDEPPAKRARLSPEKDAGIDRAVSETKKKKKTKKREKEKVKIERAELQQDVAMTDNVPVTSHAKWAGFGNDLENTEDVFEASLPTKKERKKTEQVLNASKSKQSSAVEDADSSDDEIRKRHKSVFEKKAKSMKAPDPPMSNIDGDDQEGTALDDTIEPEHLHGLEPLPQPAPMELDTSAPTYETLPSWLAAPIRVSSHAKASFTSLGETPELGITTEIAERLAAKGYEEAFAVQTAVIPQLLPHHCRSKHGDILVSAATGSGKTLAYALPMIRDLSFDNPHVTRLRALIVLPTRELVKQSQKVCDELCGVFALEGKRRRPLIAVSMGSQSLAKEQAALIERTERYDPEGYRERLKRLANTSLDLSDADDADDAEGDEGLEAIRQKEDRTKTLFNHVIEYKMKADILICTPGRLVDHLNATPGFSLEYVRWLVVDEADKLLGQTFQKWLEVAMPKLENDSKLDAFGLPLTRRHNQTNLTGVRKVILSATMTRDLDLLSGLRLRRPKLVVLEGSSTTTETEAGANADNSLPELLSELALKADENLKPLFLLDLLKSTQFTGSKPSSEAVRDSDTSSDSDDSDAESISKSDALRKSQPLMKSRGSLKNKPKVPSTIIFTNSNENAIRLTRLLALMSPDLSLAIGTLTADDRHAGAQRRQTLRAFGAGQLRILVASDLVARGIDLPALDHVINYDMPKSIASYVHRVGRTARAGRSGHAWTLFTDSQAHWFWNKVANGKVVGRSNEVKRIRITEAKAPDSGFSDKVASYEDALKALEKEATERRKK